MLFQNGRITRRNVKCGNFVEFDALFFRIINHPEKLSLLNINHGHQVMRPVAVFTNQGQRIGKKILFILRLRFDHQLTISVVILERHVVDASGGTLTDFVS